MPRKHKSKRQKSAQSSMRPQGVGRYRPSGQGPVQSPLRDKGAGDRLPRSTQNKTTDYTRILRPSHKMSSRGNGTISVQFSDVIIVPITTDGNGIPSPTAFYYFHPKAVGGILAHLSVVYQWFRFERLTVSWVPENNVNVLQSFMFGWIPDAKQTAPASIAEVNFCPYLAVTPFWAPCDIVCDPAVNGQLQWYARQNDVNSAIAERLEAQGLVGQFLPTTTVGSIYASMTLGYITISGELVCKTLTMNFASTLEVFNPWERSIVLYMLRYLSTLRTMSHEEYKSYMDFSKLEVEFSDLSEKESKLDFLDRLLLSLRPPPTPEEKAPSLPILSDSKESDPDELPLAPPKLVRR